jgi:NitT/TauT family transport system permease protein
MMVALDKAACVHRRLPRSVGFDRLLLLLAVLLLWQVLTWIAGPEVITSPPATARKLVAIINAPDFVGHAYETGRAFAAALIISLLGGLVVGLALGSRRLAGEVAEPLLVALYSIPKITLYPVILLLFGLGVSAKIAFGAIHGIIPVALFAMNAVRNIRGVHLRAARAMRLTPLQIAIHVLVPATLPEIVAGFRLGFALTLLGTLIGEMFASQRGLGYMLVQAMETNDTDTIMALALLLVTIATAASWAMLRFDRSLHGSKQH